MAPAAHLAPECVVGVDFSGAADAGRRIWLSTGTLGDQGLRVGSCTPAERLPGSAPDRAPCLQALRAFLRCLGSAIVGLDFPFGLPRSLVDEPSWSEFVLGFPGRFPDLTAFQAHCRRGGRELRRRTDCEARTPFSPYNLRLFRQTYYGIREVLHPLVGEGSARVRPMQPGLPGRPQLVEICPASTLKMLEVYRPYKGGKPGHCQARRTILRTLEVRGMRLGSKALRRVVLADAAGDALDSVCAAFAAWKAATSPLPEPMDEDYALEGYVYSGVDRLSTVSSALAGHGGSRRPRDTKTVVAR
jgi:hypothetical protein